MSFTREEETYLISLKNKQAYKQNIQHSKSNTIGNYNSFSNSLLEKKDKSVSSNSKDDKNINQNIDKIVSTKNYGKKKFITEKNSELTKSQSIQKYDNSSFKNYLNNNINSKGFYVRFFVCIIGLFFIGLNSITNCLVTEEESEGLKDKTIQFLIFYTNFLKNNKNSYSKIITIAMAVIYDIYIILGILIWIFFGKNNKFVYSTICYFSLMFFLQNLFYIEMPLVKENPVLLNPIFTNSLFLNFEMNKQSYYNGQVGFMLLILFEIQNNKFKYFNYSGLFYLVNLIIYLMALHVTNSLCIISALLAAVYFDKVSENFICPYFDLIEMIKNFIHNDDPNLKERILQNDNRKDVKETLINRELDLNSKEEEYNFISKENISLTSKKLNLNNIDNKFYTNDIPLIEKNFNYLNQNNEIIKEKLEKTITRKACESNSKYNYQEINFIHKENYIRENSINSYNNINKNEFNLKESNEDINEIKLNKEIENIQDYLILMKNKQLMNPKKRDMNPIIASGY